MPEQLISREGEDELTEAVEAALTEWFGATTVTAAATFAGAQLVSAVRWPGEGVWRRLVDEHVIPVSERLYRAGAAVVSGEALDRFLNGVRNRLVEQSTLIDDIQAAQERYGDDAASMDWTGADGDSLPWRSRAALLGGHEAQVTSMQAATDGSPGARKRWRARDDERTRPSHRQADGQAVGLDDPFSVGGAELMYPGDPNGPADEILNCRCEMYLITEERAAMTASLTAAVSVDTDLPFAPRDTKWDGAAAKKALHAWATTDGQVDEDKLARAYVWRTDGPPSDWKLPVARVEGGNLQLVWDAVTAAAAALQGARTPIDLPAADVDKAKAAVSKLYAKAAKDFDDDGITAPWDRETEASLAIAAILKTLPAAASPRTVVDALGSVVEGIEARAHAAERRSIMASALSSAIDDAKQALSGGDDGGPWTPPAEWFTPPDGSQKELISPEGRVAGYVATWADTDGAPMCHAGYAGEGECAPVPRGGDYGYFHQGNVTLTLDDGSKVHPGLLTTDIGHGPATPHVDQQIAHYDNPQAIAAAVIVGEDDKGIWMSGAVLPQVMRDADKFTRLQLTPVSGHWSETQPGGPMELIAVTSVNKPGYPQRSTSGYQLAAAFGQGEVGDLTTFRAQLAEMLATVDVLLEGGTDGPPPGIEDMPAAARRAADEDDTAGGPVEGKANVDFLEGMASHHDMGVSMARDFLEKPEADRDPRVSELAADIAEEQTEQAAEMRRMLGKDTPAKDGPPAEGDRTAAYPADVDRELVEAALKVVDTVKTMKPKELAAAALPGISLPRCLQILSDFLEGIGTEAQQARAAAVKAAESICRSQDVKNAAVRARACRLVSEYRVKAGVR